jgi:hypothetical protein
LNPNSAKTEIDAIRVLLFLIFIGFTLLAFGSTISQMPMAGATAGTFTLGIAAVAALILLLTLNYAAGLVTFIAILGTDFLLNPPLVIFSTHLAITLVFTEGVCSLHPYRLVAGNVITGSNESVTSNLMSTLARFRRTLVLVAVSLVMLSFAYGLLPDILPAVSDVTTLALYVTISLVAIGITGLYLGQRRQDA